MKEGLRPCVMLVGGLNPPGRILICSSEREYITGGVEDGIRADGRGRHDWRPVEAELHPIPQAAGSARFNLGGGTDVIASIKGDIGRPALDAPNAGQVVCTVDSSTVFSMNAALAGANEERLTQERNAELSALLHDILVKSRVLDLTSFCIVPGRHCWVLYIDVLVLNYDGNLVDAMLAAARLALASMRLPAVRVEEGGEASEVILAEEVDPSKSIPLDRLPVTITIGKIGSGFVIDPTGPEELCCDAGLVVSLVGEQIVAVRKLGGGMVDPGLLSEYLEAARQASQDLFSKISLSLASPSPK